LWSLVIGKAVEHSRGRRYGCCCGCSHWYTHVGHSHGRNRQHSYVGVVVGLATGMLLA
jgi:hypothetical protein